MTKTAVMQLLEWLESESERTGFLERYKAKKQEILEIEKQQIIDAYNYSWRTSIALGKPLPEDPIGYYKDNYGSHEIDRSL